MTKFAREFVEPKSLGQAFQGVSAWKFPHVLQTQGSTKLPRLIHDSSRETYQISRPKNTPMQIRGALFNLYCYFCNRTFLQTSPKACILKDDFHHQPQVCKATWMILLKTADKTPQPRRVLSVWVWVLAISGFREIRIERKPWNFVIVSTV